MRNVIIDNPALGPRPSEPSPVFAAIRARSLLAMFVAAGALWIGAFVLLWPEELEIEEAPLPDALTGLALYALLALFLWLACLRAGVIDRFSLGRRPERRETWAYILLAVPLIGMAVVGLYILYLPLSYFFPAFVTEILLEELPPLIWWRAEPQFLLASLINALMLVVIAPVIEETFFRGFLLSRWWRKYGVPRAVVFSSLAFAFVHVDIIGGFVFGVVLSLIYVKTKSLIGPIIVHASNNAITILEVLLEGVVTGEIEMVYTLEEFRSYWWLALLGAAVGVPWLLWFVKRLLRREAVAA